MKTTCSLFAEMLRGAHSEACAAMLREAGR